MSAPPELTPPAADLPSPSGAPLRLSELLRQIAEDPGRERISLEDLLVVMKARAFGALLLVFAFPNILPSPPGLAGVLGLPLLFLASQMMLGQSPWLPRFIAKRSLPRGTFQAMVTRATPWLHRAERLLRVRLQPLASAPAQRVLGGFVLILAVALALPIPFANMAPAVAICIIGLGILERDGLSVLVGAIAGLAALTYVSALGYALVKSALFVLMNTF